MSQGATKIDENTSDGYHSFKELYHYRALYNAAWVNELTISLAADLHEGRIDLAEFKGWDIHKSWRHSTGEECFDGGWFIVIVNLPTGQISNHYAEEYWDTFHVEERDFASEWDGHSPQEAADRLEKYLKGEWNV